MTDFRSAKSVGARIRGARKRLGMRVNDLANSIGVSSAVIENIEGGRKPDLSISEVLNLSMALGVPPVYLLAPMGSSGQTLDLPNLIGDFAAMTALEFDSWLAGSPNGAYRPLSVAERNDRYELQTLRELEIDRGELRRLTVQLAQEQEAMPASEAARELMSATLNRISETEQRISRLAAVLQSAGWAVGTSTN